jgi:hypothetical protein
VEHVGLAGTGKSSVRQRYQPHRRRGNGREPLKRNAECAGHPLLAVRYQAGQPGYGLPAAKCRPVRQALRGWDEQAAA